MVPERLIKMCRNSNKNNSEQDIAEIDKAGRFYYDVINYDILRYIRQGLT